jgi:hypothetical protein
MRIHVMMRQRVPGIEDVMKSLCPECKIGVEEFSNDN